VSLTSRHHDTRPREHKRQSRLNQTLSTLHPSRPAGRVHAHRDAHFYCGTRIDFGPIRERLKASRSTSSGSWPLPWKRCWRPQRSSRRKSRLM